MIWMDKILKKLGFMPKFTEDDIINASTEDAARVHETAVSRLHEATQRRMKGNDALRQSLIIAKIRTNSFEDFERQVQQREPKRNVRRSD